MKKLIALITVLLVLTSLFAFAANAEGETVGATDNTDEYGVTIAVSAETGKLKAGDTFSVTATVTDIKDETGLAVLEYMITYDKAILELVDTEFKLPDFWEQYLGTDDFENLSTRLEDDNSEIAGTGKSAYMWSLVSIKEKNALHEGGKTSITLKFKVIEDGTASVEFIPGTVTNDDLIEIGANKVTVSIQAGDTEASKQSVSIDGNIGEVTEESSSPLVFIIIGLVVLFVVVLALVFWFVKKKNK